MLRIELSGIGALSEALSGLVPEGAQILEGILARYFDALLEVLDRYDGMLVKLSSRALMVAFPAGTETLHHAAVRAVACANALKPANRPAARVITRRSVVHLRHRMGIGCGEMRCAQLGDPSLRTVLVFGGVAVERARQASRNASHGGVWACAETVRQLAHPAWWDREGPRGERQLAGRSCPELLDLFPPPPSTKGPPLAAGPSSGAYRDLIPAFLRPHVGGGPPAIHGHHALALLFVYSPDLHGDPSTALPRLDAHLRLVQRIVDRHGGHLGELEERGRGFGMLAWFGAPIAPSDSFDQAVACAEELLEAGRALGLVKEMRLGVTTGRVYVGPIGCRRWITWAVLGSRIDVAVRLAATARGWCVVAERAVADSRDGGRGWSPPRVLPGVREVESLEVRALSVPRDSRSRERRGLGYVGRQAGRQRCGRRLEALAAHGRGAILLITGPAGIGKTRMLEILGRQARERGCRVVHPSPSLSPAMAIEAAIERGLQRRHQPPHLVLIDDGDRLDGASIRTLRRLAAGGPLPGMGVAVAVRSGPDGGLVGLEGLPAGQVERIELGPLSPGEVGRLAADRLGGRSVDPGIEGFLLARSGGNPLRIETWCTLLRQCRAVGLEGGVARARIDLEATFPVTGPPEDLTGLIRRLVQAMSLETRCMLEAASRIGPLVTPAEVAAIHPEEVSEPVARVHLHLAARAGLMRYVRGARPQLAFSRIEVMQAVRAGIDDPRPPVFQGDVLPELWHGGAAARP